MSCPDSKSLPDGLRISSEDIVILRTLVEHACIEVEAWLENRDTTLVPDDVVSLMAHYDWGKRFLERFK